MINTILLTDASSIELYCLGTVDLNLLERDQLACPEDFAAFTCTVFRTSLLRWNIGGSSTQISCFGSSRTCLGGGNGIHALITSVSSDPANPDISNITSTLIIHKVTTDISVECESQLTSSVRDIQILST